MKLIPTGIAGCVRIVPPVHEDARGRFVKVFHAPMFAELGLDLVIAESYYSTSRRGVLRGMHLQTGPAAHAKLVYCVAGAALDAVLDLRPESESHGRHALIELEADRPELVFVPPGVAHGFLAREEGTTLVYATSTPHRPEHDTGVRWDSAGIPWGVQDPVVSPRDAALPPFAAPRAG